MNELIDDLRVHELERSLTFVDDRDLDAERGEHRSVFDADDAGAHDGERSREPRERTDVVARDHRVAVRPDAVRRNGACAARNQDVRRRDLTPVLARRDAQPVRVDERRLAAENVDAVARQLIDDDRAFARNHFIDTRQ